jgi:DNA repair protein RadA/Sms
MGKSETIFVCNSCGNEFSKWQGQCSFCGEWNSLREIGKVLKSGQKGKPGFKKTEVVYLSKVKKTGSLSKRLSTKIGEFDNVLGKGIVPGSVTLFAGEPGIGKSTLLTQVVGKIGGLYVGGEESAEQIKMRVDRLNLDPDKFEVLPTNRVEEVIEELEGRALNLEKKMPGVVVVDSIQVMNSDQVASGAGSVAQIRECTFRLIEVAKRLGVTVFVVGHVTKGGDIAGPKLLEHMVDVVLYFEGEKNGDFRILRSVKNRFGSTDEVGIFKMTDKGLLEVRGEELNFVEEGESKIGSALTVVLEGGRTMMVEIQALVTESFSPVPKRIFAGIGYARGQLLTAVAQKVLAMPLYKCDVYISVAGGLKIQDTGADLSVIAALWSSYKNRSFVKKEVFVGEVSLLGGVRKVRGMDKREKECKAMGGRMVEIKRVGQIRSV